MMSEMHTISYYDFLDIINFVNRKYSLGLNDDAVWHWITDTWEINNGKIFPVWPSDFFDRDDMPEFVEGLMKHMQTEYGDEFKVRTSW